MKNWFMGLLVAGVALALIPATSDARRLGGGKSTGMQRAAPDKPAPSTPATPAATPNAPAAPAAAAAPTAGAAAAAAAPKRSWMGPIAGLAAGLGLAALFSHLGMGEQFANFIMLALLAVVAIVVIRLLVRRFAGGRSKGMSYAMAGAPGSADGVEALARRESVTPAWSGASSSASFLPPPVAAPALALPAAPALPVGFDTEAFERIAKMIFIRLQAANDSADLNDLRAFTTPELFASLRVDLQDRGNAAQQTDVVEIDARIVDFAQEDDHQVVSVRYQGLVREDPAAGAVPFDEVWHLVKPLDDSRAWAIAGIQQQS